MCVALPTLVQMNEGPSFPRAGSASLAVRLRDLARRLQDGY